MIRYTAVGDGCADYFEDIAMLIMSTSSVLVADNYRVRFATVVAVILQLLTAQFTDQASPQASRAPAPASALYTASADTLKLDLVELRKLGISSEDVLRHIRLLVEGRRHAGLGRCLDQALAEARSSSPTPGRVPPVSAADRSPARSAPGAAAGGGYLRRQFVRNKTVTCNDGSKAGYGVDNITEK